MWGTTLSQWPWRCTTHPNVIWIVSLRSVFFFSMIDDQEVIYPCLFAFIFLGNVLVVFFQHALTFAIERKIALASDVCFNTPIIIKSHDLHAGDIKGAMGEITSYHERDQLSTFFSFFGFYKLCIFWPFFGLFFCLPCDGFGHQSFIGFL